MDWSRWRILLGIIGVLIFLGLASFLQEMNRRWHYQQEVDQLHEEAAGLEKKVVELEHLNQYFKTDEYQERLAREKLNYQAEGEKVVLIPQEVEEELSRKIQNTAADEVTQPSNPIRWWRALFVDSLP